MTRRTLEQLARDVVAVWVDKGCTSTDLGRPIAALAARLDELDRVVDELDEVASRPHNPEQLLARARRRYLHELDLDELAARAARAQQAAAQYDSLDHLVEVLADGRVHGEGSVRLPPGSCPECGASERLCADSRRRFAAHCCAECATDEGRVHVEGGA